MPCNNIHIQRTLQWKCSLLLIIGKINISHYVSLSITYISFSCQFHSPTKIRIYEFPGHYSSRKTFFHTPTVNLKIASVNFLFKMFKNYQRLEIVSPHYSAYLHHNTSLFRVLTAQHLIIPCTYTTSPHHSFIPTVLQLQQNNCYQHLPNSQ